MRVCMSVCMRMRVCACVCGCVRAGMCGMCECGCVRVCVSGVSTHSGAHRQYLTVSGLSQIILWCSEYYECSEYVLVPSFRPAKSPGIEI